jgi:hypothetical protein
MPVILAGQQAEPGQRESRPVYAVAAVCCCRRMTLKRQSRTEERGSHAGPTYRLGGFDYGAY